jgi:hypothetical protein
MGTRAIKLALLILMVISLSGCGTSLFSTRQTDPIVSDYVGIWPFPGAVGILAPDASRRITVVRLKNASSDYSDKKWQAGEFCSEPPPDAMINTLSKLAKSLNASINSSGVPAEGSADEKITRKITSDMSPLLVRSQALQWTRDNLSFLCNARLNRAISKADYLGLLKDIISLSNKMMLEEIKLNPVKQNPACELKIPEGFKGKPPKSTSPSTTTKK